MLPQLTRCKTLNTLFFRHFHPINYFPFTRQTFYCVGWLTFSPCH